ncbi:universal stress protein [Ekhidna sp.]|uniref:universal stress protein n=1 Tax=Ekhidna sp. TaxID=2608089 RepID=UPI0032ED8D20
MISSILIPTDFSPASWQAAQLGMELSKIYGDATISFLHIYPASSKYSLKNGPKATNSQLEEVEQRMNQLSQDMSGVADDRIQNVVLSGNVEELMMQFIKEHNFDLVIVGINSNGHDNEIGSHTVRVIKESGIPVMIVPNRAAHGTIAS